MSSATLAPPDPLGSGDLLADGAAFLADLYVTTAEQIRPKDKRTTSQCADAHRVLGPRSAEPGEFRTDRVPYLRAVQDAMGDPRIIEIAVMKSSQSALTEAMRSALDYWVRDDPGDVLWIFPTERAVRKTFEKHLLPLCRNLDTYTIGGEQAQSFEKLRFRGMDVDAGWMGSATTVSSDPYRRVAIDEADKNADFVGSEGDPLDLARARIRTYQDAGKAIVISTPTTSAGPIARAFNSIADKRYFWVPCEACGEHQILTWQQVRWAERPENVDRILWAERVGSLDLARYHCAHCKHEHDTLALRRQVKRGEWRSVLSKEEAALSVRVAFHISALYNPWTTLSALAEKWLKAQGDIAKLQSFSNDELGEPFEQQVASTDGDVYKRKAQRGYKRLVIPAYAGLTIATADTQKDGLWWSIRAYGQGFRSRLIDYGFAADFPMLADLTLKRALPIEDSDEVMVPRYLLIDAGGGVLSGDNSSSTDQVYRFSLTDPTRIIPVKGHGGKRRASRPFYMSKVDYRPPGWSKPAYSVNVGIVDTQHYKDVISSAIGAEDDDLWEVPSDIDDEYCKQMSAEHKILARSGPMKGQLWWQPRSHGAPNHLWDTETYSRAGAELAQVAFLPGEAELRKQREQVKVFRRRAEEEAKAQPQAGQWVNGRGWWQR